MKTLRYLFISLSWLPMIALAAWWAGFMPFPTQPEELGSESINFTGGFAEDRIHSVGLGYQLLISAAEARNKVKLLRFGLGSWDCDVDNKQHCQLYLVREEPFFGLGSPRWVLTINSDKGGATATALYSTYAACKWNEGRRQKESHANQVSYARWATEQHQKIENQGYEFYSCVRTPK
jgi:hypothetical protein